MTTQSSPIAQPVTLHTMLRGELEICRCLLNASRLKTKALIGGDSHDIIAQDQAILPLSQKAALLAEQRMAWIMAQGTDSGALPEYLLTVSGEEANELTYLRLELRRILMDIEAENREHQTLITLSLRWIQQSISAIGNALSPQGASYNASGHSTGLYQAANGSSLSNKPYAAIPLGGPVHTTDSVDNAPLNHLNRLPNGGLIPHSLQAYQQAGALQTEVRLLTEDDSALSVNSVT
jgi:hypothetical protein